MILITVKITIITLAILVVLFLALLLASCFFDDCIEVDNSDGSIICAIANEPCIKDKLYMKSDNCAGCDVADEAPHYGAY